MIVGTKRTAHSELPGGRVTSIAGQTQVPDGIPALALGSGLTALGVLRSLRAAGIQVYSACPPSDLPGRSRWYQPAPLHNGAVPEPAQLAEYLHSLPLERAVLFPCSDDWACAIAGLPDDLRRRFPASISPLKIVETMTDKWLFAMFTACVDIPRPATLRVTTLDELRSLNTACFENMFLKPVDSLEFSRRFNLKGFQIRDKQHAVDIMTQVEREGIHAFPILLQEYIPGLPNTHYLLDGFVDSHRNIRALLARRRLSQYPPLLGNTAGTESIPVSVIQSGLESVRKMWAAIPYRGIFSVEFAHDIRDRQLKIIEVNARPWWYVEFATRCGVDVCRLSYLDALEVPVDTIDSYHTGRRCVHLGYHLASHMEEPGAFGRLAGWARSTLGAEDIVFRWDDPLPGIHTAVNGLKAYVRGRRQTLHTGSTS